jgi:hypothetical protein
MSNTELVNFTDQDNFAAIAALTGASISNAVYLPRLKINKDAIDEEGKPIPMGTFAVSQNDKTFYGKTASFRVFLNRFQYYHYDQKEKKYVNRSIQIKNFYEEAIDMLGGLKCGKLTAKQLAEANLDASIQKDIKCVRLLYGTVNIPKAETVDGEKDNIENLPVVMRLAGKQFTVPQTSLDAITQMKHQYFQHMLHLHLSKPQKNGATIYFDLLIDPDYKNVVPFTEEDMATFKVFQETIDRDNNWVSKKFTEAKRGAVKALASEDDAAILSALDLNDPIDDLLAE